MSKIQNDATIDSVLSLYGTVMGQAAHIDDVRVNISLLILTVAAGAVPAILSFKPRSLRKIASVMLLILGVCLTAMHMHYGRTYHFHLEYADKLIQLGYAESKKNQTVTYAWISRKRAEVWKDETSFWITPLKTSWFYVTFLAGIIMPFTLLICMLRRRE